MNLDGITGPIFIMDQLMLTRTEIISLIYLRKIGLNGFHRKDIDALEGRQLGRLGRIAYINFFQVGSLNSQDLKWYCADVSSIALVNIFQSFLPIWSKKCLPPFVEITTPI